MDNECGEMMHIHKLDRMFKKNHLNWDEFALLSDNNRVALLRLLWEYTELGMTAIEKKCFTVHEYLAFTSNQQNELIRLFHAIDEPWGYRRQCRSHLDDCSQAVLDQINKKIAQFKLGEGLKKDKEEVLSLSMK